MTWEVIGSKIREVGGGICWVRRGRDAWVEVTAGPLVLSIVTTRGAARGQQKELKVPKKFPRR